MYTQKDLECKTIFVVNCIHERNLRVKTGELLLEECVKEEKRTLTKLPFQKILALFIVGNITITTPLLELCKRHNVAVVVLKRSLRPVFFWSSAAEGNFLVRTKQHAFPLDQLVPAKNLMACKFSNQLSLLKKSRQKDELTVSAIDLASIALEQLPEVDSHASLMGLEGIVAKSFFRAYFQRLGWSSRKPRTKVDPVNVVLDIGYSILFNFVECFVRLFGFDLYVGFYHRLWFRRKSLVCDLMEPFRCLIDKRVRIAFNRLEFSTHDFELHKGEYHLKREKMGHYYQVFFECLIPYKTKIFLYVRDHYRYFMKDCKPTINPPMFNL